MLTIKGEKQEEKEEMTKDRYVSERCYGSFRRTLHVPAAPTMRHLFLGRAPSASNRRA